MADSGPGEPSKPLTSIEICAGAGGQAVGLHQAGFQHLALVEWDAHAVATLKANAVRWPGWSKEKAERLTPQDVTKFLSSEQLEELSTEDLDDLDLLAGGVPCPPFSLAGKQLGPDDERDLFPAALEIIKRLRPKAIMIENVRGILEPPDTFIGYRRSILSKLAEFGYSVPKIKEHWSVEDQNHEMQKVWRRVDAANFGVPQLRPRAILVAIREDCLNGREFIWPEKIAGDTLELREALVKSMRERYDRYAETAPKEAKQAADRAFETWHSKAGGSAVAPTLVGGSKKHGGADLGPTRAKNAWKKLGVDGNGVANDPEKCDPERDLFRPAGPMLTVRQAATLQGFPEDWDFQGGKTARYRQVGNAFPPPVAEAIGRAIAAVLRPAEADSLLEGYVLASSNGEDATDPYGTQDTLDDSLLAKVHAPGDDRRSDLVGADA
ncbi:DNA cytosine methyltransferase [Actinacidiphila glaucinigra]|uniref:Cytosine-specific methyltransferase n=1 Tax=Actinacidiphila glaucinigra TaxID=235986 RepID=A0A239BA23_9ACTN|nr:DNA (cytosine-5-)-methyltransferase [Actinacidiphila glaucinigra]SNS04549.1 DNA (cytosine-5)-methyltransferase 1 [Actinacidiphila glaucinigra]